MCVFLSSPITPLFNLHFYTFLPNLLSLSSLSLFISLHITLLAHCSPSALSPKQTPEASPTTPEKLLLHNRRKSVHAAASNSTGNTHTHTHSPLCTSHTHTRASAGASVTLCTLGVSERCALFLIDGRWCGGCFVFVEKPTEKQQPFFFLFSSSGFLLARPDETEVCILWIDRSDAHIKSCRGDENK